MKSISILSGLLVSTLALAGCGEPAAPASSADAPPPAAVVMVSDAWCRPSPNAAKAGACYVTLLSEDDDRLMGGSTPRADQLQVHEMTTDNGVMRMRQLAAGLELRQGQAVMLTPGGNHLMLVGLNTPLVAGDTVPLTLTFDKAPAVTVQATVGPRPSDDGEHAGH